MSSKFTLYKKANKVRTSLLLFVDREINQQKQKEKIENKPIIIKAHKYQNSYIQFEETFENCSKQEETATTQMDSRNNKLKIIKPRVHPFSTSVANVLNFQLFGESYGSNKFLVRRDTTICFTPVAAKKTKVKNHEKYLHDIVRFLKKIKNKKKTRKFH